MGHSQISQPEHRNTHNSQNSLHQNIPQLYVYWRQRQSPIHLNRAINPGFYICGACLSYPYYSKASCWISVKVQFQVYLLLCLTSSCCI